MQKILFFVLGFLFLVPRLFYSQDSIPRRIYVTQSMVANTPPRIDGIIDDNVWDLVDWSGNYVEWSPDENTTPSQATKLKILYNDKNLYIAFRCYDQEPEKIVSRLSRRDGFDGDWVEINLGSLGDKPLGTPSGTQRQILMKTGGPRKFVFRLVKFDLVRLKNRFGVYSQHAAFLEKKSGLYGNEVR